MSKTIDIKFNLNQQEITDRVDGEIFLLTYLRRIKGLTGAKLGCGKHQCGTCIVLINSEPKKSCVIRLKSPKLENAIIETIEGLVSPEGNPHPIQESFARVGALQCGFCTPGLIMSVKGLLTKKPAPSRDDIQSYLETKNYCRCTGYQKIFEAIQLASRKLKGESIDFESFPNDAPMRY